MKRYALKGINDDAADCTCCGKPHLKRVLWIVELDQDGAELSDPFPCGSTCGAKMLGYTTAKLKTKVNNFEHETKKKRDWLEYNHPATKQADKLREQLNSLKIMGAARFQHPLFKQLLELQQTAKEWAQQQPVLVEL